MVIKYDTEGLGFAELFAEPGLFDLLPGVMPSEADVGDEWDDELEAEPCA